MDDLKACPNCLKGILVPAPFGPRNYRDSNPQPATRENRPPPNRVFGSIQIDNCATGIKVSGGYSDLSELKITMTDTPTAFELDRDAVIEVFNVTHHSGTKQKTPRGRKPKHRKR
jgi:hypothetical protein